MPNPINTKSTRVRSSPSSSPVDALRKRCNDSASPSGEENPIKHTYQQQPKKSCPQIVNATNSTYSFLRTYFKTAILLVAVMIFIVYLATWFILSERHHQSESFSSTSYSTSPVLKTLFSSRKKVEPPYIFNKAAVATDSPLCSKVGERMLADLHGNAVDAYIASSLCLGVTRPFASGIGGGGFAVVHMQQNGNHPSDTGSFSIDFREYAGENSFQDMYEDAVAGGTKPKFHYGHYDNSTYGASSTTVPGELKGMYEMHKRFGKLEWSFLFEDAIRLAEKGFFVSELLELRCKQREKDIFSSPTLMELLTVHTDNQFAKNNRRLLRKGDFLKQPKLGNTLRRIAQSGGVDVFYNGDMMHKIVDKIQGMGSSLTKEDFRKYHVRIKPALQKGNIKADVPNKKSGFSILTTDAPSSGSIVSFAISLLDKLNQKYPFSSRHETYFPYGHHPHTFHVRFASYWHYIIESLKHAFSHRTFIGDPEFIPEVNNFQQQLSDDSYVDNILSKISPQQTYTDWSHYAVDDTLSQPHDSGTTAISIIDQEGNAISGATTVNHSFGSLVYLKELGFIMNNHMSDFSVSRTRRNVFGFLPSKRNIIGPFRRPVSSISPIIILKHGKNEGDSPQVWIAASASGGSTIISALTQIISSHMFFGVPPSKSIPQPRLHILPGMDEVKMESGFPHTYLSQLEKFGHRFKHQGILADGHSIGNVQCITRDLETGRLEAFSDERKLGMPAGF